MITAEDHELAIAVLKATGCASLRHLAASAVLDRLAPEQRRVLSLRLGLQDGVAAAPRSEREVAAACGLSLEQVQNQMAAALAALEAAR